MEKVHNADNTELHAEPGRFEVAIWRAERASPTRIFRCTMGVHAVLAVILAVPPRLYGYGRLSKFDSKTIGVGAVEAVPVGRARLKIVTCHFWCNLRIFRHFFSRTFPTGLQHDIHHRSPRQIIIHSEHENSRVGQIASRSDRDRQGHSIRRAAQPAPFTTHFCSSHTCPSSFDQLRPACPSLAGISPVSRSISPVSHRD